MKSIVEILNEAIVEDWDSPDFNDFISEIEKAFKDSGYKITTDQKSTEENTVVKIDLSGKIIEYILILGRNGDAYIGLDLFVNKEKDNKVSINCKLSYSNGKNSYSLRSTAAKRMRMEFDFEQISSSTILPNWAGGRDYYICTKDIATKFINGIYNLKNYEYEFKDAISKSRFTDSRWNKLCDIMTEAFELNNKKITVYHHMPWEDK